MSALFDKDGKRVAIDEIEGFNDLRSLRQFIADNYDEHSELFDEALGIESSALPIALYDYKIDICGDFFASNSRVFDDGTIRLTIHYDMLIKPNEPLLKDAQSFTIVNSELNKRTVQG